MQFLSRLLGFIRTREEARPEILEVRHQLAGRFMAPILWAGLLGICLGALRSSMQGQWVYSILYLALYLAILAVAAFRGRIPFWARAHFLVVFMFLLSILVLSRTGLNGTGLQIMIVACVLTHGIMGLRMGLICLAAGLASSILLAAAMMTGWMPLDPQAVLASNSPLSWCIAIVTFALVAGGLIVIPHRYIDRLKESLAQLEKHSHRLKRSNQILRDQIRTRKKTERDLSEAFETNKKVVDELTESHRQFRQIYQTIPDPVTIVRTRDGHCLDVNDRFVAETGWSREEVIGEGFKKLDIWARPGDRDRMVEEIRRTDRLDNLEARFRLKDGRIITSLLSATSLNIGGEKVIVSITRDITDRAMAQKALKESEEKYRLVVDNANEWIVLSQGERIVFANKQAIEQSGYTAEELSSMKLPDLIHPADKADAVRKYVSMLGGGKGSGNYEFRVIYKNGEIHWVRVNSFLVNWLGEPTLLTFMNDISRQKEAEEQKENLKLRLQRAQKMEAIGTLAGGVAHDLNNILSGIVSYPDLLLTQLPGNSPLIKPVQTIKESGKRAAAVVQDLLTLARRGLAVTEPVGLNALVKGYLESAEFERLQSLHPHVRVETRLDRELRCLSGSPVHLQKTLMNLVVNAFEAMPEGGTVHISTENRRMDKFFNGYDRVQEGEYVMLRVSDTGVGITPEEQERIFEPFYTKKIMGRSGTGLGMAVVWGTVKDHQGSIDVESTPGEGTTFTLYFPSTTGTPKDRETVSMERYMGRGESILVIDDMADQREITSTLLAKLGYSVVAAASGEDAVTRVKEKPQDLLILDMIMGGGMDGLDTYREILKTHPSQRAILASGYSETERVKEAQRLGAGQYIRKPYTIEMIGLAVRSELDRNEEMRSAECGMRNHEEVRSAECGVRN